MAGSAKRMPADVKKAFIAALDKEHQATASNGAKVANYGESVINALIRSKRYVIEAWE